MRDAVAWSGSRSNPGGPRLPTIFDSLTRLRDGDQGWSPQCRHLLKSSNAIDPAVMIAYALETKSRLVISRLGFFLWCARCPLGQQFYELAAHGVKKPTCFQRSARTDLDSHVERWNLIVSPELQLIIPRN